ncbi:2-oxoglutarate dehydrogenase complex dihydrolipoyllysine-residue succinyltransferase [Paludifilum halophilum]|uniref:Dihydrolipoyllysine-residue succinyltransferase component of 2-oxoglutarate dehydrogenase complex n=1 Tax=Paludifilum halophilum TaxID=1642702 RepID=A0A235B844_9BACL|nr:2-oxoglutarate dehydrogenase complex dihydrolipoyllysine-residue succinyltransferase [Paludifilum halophilum]OYD08483.1 dihydrolipoyllysine-residue succinyltransferase [Paludifilum halophilum]
MIEVKVPELAESITEGTISSWSKDEGDSVTEGEVLLELETDKVNLEIQAENTGVLAEVLKQPGDSVEVGEVIALLKEGAEEGTKDSGAPEPEGNESRERTEKAAGEAAEQPQTEKEAPHKEVPPVASPAARKLARERGLDLNRIQTRDPMGRVTVEDVKNHPAQPSRPATEESPGKQQTGRKEPVQPTGEADRPVERQRMSRRRQTIANRLVQAQQNAAMLTTFNEVDMSAVMDLRRRRKEAFKEKHDIGLGFMSFFTKAVVGALKEFPRLNAEIQGDEMLLKKYYDIGIAVAAEEGLVVPVVRNADRLSFAEIEQDIASLAEKARTNALTLDDLQGGTFSITNGGIFGSLLSTPILNTPQVGILGMHSIQKRPVAVDGDRMENRPMMYIALSYDHRIVDGSEAVRFLVKIKELLEDPELLMLEG